MNEAVEIRLSDIAEINPPLPQGVADGDLVSFVSMAQLSSEAAATEGGEDRPYSEVKKGYTPFLRGDLLVAKITPCFENSKIGRAAIERPVGAGSTEFHVIRPDAQKADARYLLYFLRQQRVIRDGEQRMVGSAGQRRVPEAFLAELKLPLASLGEQRRIAALLDQVADLQAKRMQAIAKLDTLAQSVFSDMFGDPVTNPKGWHDPKLDAVLSELQYGPRFYNETYVPDGTRIVRITDLDEAGELDFRSMPRLEVTEADRAKYLLQPGDLIFARTGATVGKVALIREGDPPCIAGAYFISMRFKDSIHPAYARAVLTAPSIRAIVAKRSRQAAQQNFSGPALRLLPMPVPPIDLQVKFSKTMQGIQRLKQSFDQSRKRINSLFDSLQHVAFRGEL